MTPSRPAQNTTARPSTVRRSRWRSPTDAADGTAEEVAVDTVATEEAMEEIVVEDTEEIAEEATEIGVEAAADTTEAMEADRGHTEIGMGATPAPGLTVMEAADTKWRGVHVLSF